MTEAAMIEKIVDAMIKLKGLRRRLLKWLFPELVTLANDLMKYCHETGGEGMVLVTQEQFNNLKEFARDIIMDECWDLGGTQSRDGGDVQEWAENLGFIVKKKATREEADGSGGLFDEGEARFVFAEILAE